MTAREANFDGLIGPTHNYGGLSEGNLASANNAGLVSRPRDAALQGLDKMLSLARAGLVQGVAPPQERPYTPFLRAAGFSGADVDVLESAWKAAPELVRNATSASPMWMANAATVSPSMDAADGRLHFTPANLNTMLHRSFEAPSTQRWLERVFANEHHFAVHDPLASHAVFADEGAANHVRLCSEHGAAGVEIFVDGRDGFESGAGRAFPARQSRVVGAAIARRHSLDPARAVFARQSQDAIDAGAFHNDVVCVGTKTCLFFHERAFADTDAMMADIDAAAAGLFSPDFVMVAERDVPIADAVASYLFNSQLLEWPGEERLVLVAPTEARDNDATRSYCERLEAGNGPIGRVEFVDVRQSMKNGGGPACLRLRVVLSEQELGAVRPAALLDASSHEKLSDWVSRRYREELSPNDLGDPALLNESREALDELTGLLDLGGDFYDFQRV